MQLSRDDLKRAYERMFLIRTFEERVEKEFSAGNIPGFVHVYVGQEACGVGVCFDLTDDDYIGSTHRGHGHCIAKGVEVEGMMLELMGKASGLCGGKGGSMHIADLKKGMLGANAIVGGAPPIAVGAALTQKLKNTGRVAVAFSGDGGANQGTVFESFNMAMVLRAPVIFAFENNGYGEFTGQSYACGGVSIAERVRGFGMPCEQVDGMDFFAVREAMQQALEHARGGNGPYALEIRCKRFRGHFVGDPQNYRSAEELADALASDPIPRFRRAVTKAALLRDADFDEIESAVQTRVEAAVRSALAAPMPDPANDLTRDVYVKYA
ncbi:thiamine pyrophosphate-dependent dehydrogenase E1 component subunit alpha [Bradyrhizobium yuanmingense]|uniref:thiamine pyrophosphate-dependent dehydrogenase E1 component subunit alpha n=1 Tax=Bradyrhizobium yuanmingense TaxID=108015 RepID=UPI0023B97D8B|nr:thiamine pyrophosphate-dependent dehydrogenase E1 component subunit alpha [Bradyrhizobium yuanmingense]MDF0498619.1 thiamine pyrophosphate-dependent dehydrogenase E1 component subunit alpha [Bradyrhizobium yuanmingense]